MINVFEINQCVITTSLNYKSTQNNENGFITTFLNYKYNRHTKLNNHIFVHNIAHYINTHTLFTKY